jgi:hypothetical protein
VWWDGGAPHGGQRPPPLPPSDVLYSKNAVTLGILQLHADSRSYRSRLAVDRPILQIHANSADGVQLPGR